MHGKSVKDFSLPSTGGTFGLCDLRGSRPTSFRMPGRTSARNSAWSTWRTYTRCAQSSAHAQEVSDFAEALW